VRSSRQTQHRVENPPALRHVGGKLRAAYEHLGQEALQRLEEARDSSRYEPSVRGKIARAMRGRRFGDQA